jgi:hypothetical protein
MSPDGLKALGEDIKAHGLKTDIVLWSATDKDDAPVYLLDGRNRLDAMAAVGLLRLRKDDDNYGCLAEQPSCKGYIRVVEGADPYALVFSLNIHRRHLTAEQKRELIAKLLEADPNKSDRQIGRIIKADNKTVASVRAEKEAREELPHVETRTDSKGRKQPAKKSKKPTKPVRSAAPKSDPRVIAPEIAERVSRFAHKLIQLDIDLARELASLVWVHGALERLWADLDTGLDIEERAAEDTEASAERRKAEFAALDDGLDIPEYLRRNAS